MPAKNVLKLYVKGGYYHIYNRGVEKRIIFQDKQDYSVFLSFLKEYLSPKEELIKTLFTLKGESFKGVPHQNKNYFENIKLICYCLMPNHFHLLINQSAEKAVENFMRSLATRYSMYFNKKYDRIGSLFQGPYKAVLVTDDTYLLHLSRYIHLNPSEYADDLEKEYSSYTEYLRKRKTTWINPEIILKFFENNTNKEFQKFNSYQKFVEEYKKDSSEILGRLTLED